ncbi:MAG: HAMP domain-containing sensor histidine kinase [Calditrichia bacterium]|nr:HAMP domain-containing protein [Calditrichota bacterium]MCB9067390.1 HAMP domain-containing protein [Calditrichia bacterium]
MKFWQTFYGKLSGIFLLLLVVMGLTLMFITISASRNFQSQTDQQLNKNLAKNMAPELLPAMTDSLNLAEMEHLIHYIMVLNPKIEIYVLDSTGNILAFFAEPHKKVQQNAVNLDPVMQFLGQSGNNLVLGDDPRHPSRQKPFSAAPVKIGAQSGYLYIITESEQFDTTASVLRGDFLTRTIAKGLLLSILVTGVIGLILFALLTRRIRHMNEVVQDFEQGQLKRRVGKSASDEIGQLGISFNRMANTIEANLAELKKTDQLRRDLIANVSHDLRSPLASIKGYIETLQIKEAQLDPEERQKYLNILLNVTGSLNQQVEQLFELSRLDAMQVQPELEPFALGDLVQDVIMKFNVTAEKKGIRLRADVPGGLPQVMADIGLIERALSNLIDNAIRYTPENGTVKIEVVKAKNHLRVEVSDTGVGIDEQDLPLIFDRFYRVEKSRARSTGGAGLGLAITKKIIELHNSAIRVSSQRNVGTTFSFDLATY